jgi:hypothetical protein
MYKLDLYYKKHLTLSHISFTLTFDFQQQRFVYILAV